MASFGIYDTQDDCWLGDDSGPKIFDDYMLARIAAQLADEQLRQAPGRCIAKEYEDGQKRLKDTVDTKMDTLTALRRLEGQ